MEGYKAELSLLLGLFRICSGNAMFRDRVSDILQDKDNKKLLKDIRNWIKEIATQFSHLIRTDRIGFWRKPRHANFSYQTLTNLLEMEDNINVDKFLQSLNSIIEKHKSFLKNSSEPNFAPNDRVMYQEKNEFKKEYKFWKSYGLLAELQTRDGRIKVVPLDEVSKVVYF